MTDKEITTDAPGLPSWPERRARRTAANAVLADFRRDYDAFIHAPLTAQVIFDGITWACRLADHMSTLIPCVDDRPATP